MKLLKKVGSRSVFVGWQEIMGIKLAKPENIWGVSLPPDDWKEGGVL